MRIALAAGGTGGHLYPALGAAGELRRRDPGCDCFFFVSERGTERGALQDAGFPFAELPVRTLRGGAGACAAGLVRMARAYRRAGRLMRERGTEALVGFGAYVSVPPALAARAIGLRLVIHESNAVMGAANRFLARFADAVALGMPLETGGRPGRRGEVTGTPLRPGIARGMGRAEARRLLGIAPGALTLLVSGGSQGARALNDAAAGAAGLLAREGGIQVVHLAGGRDADGVRRAYAEAGVTAAVFPYLEEMERAYAAADAAVCRAGAMTLAELAQAGLPAVVVPLPRAAGNHQEANARRYESHGGVEVLLERDLTPGRLADRVIRMLRDAAGRERMALALRALARPDAAGRLAGLIERIVAGGAGASPPRGAR